MEVEKEGDGRISKNQAMFSMDRRFGSTKFEFLFKNFTRSKLSADWFDCVGGRMFSLYKFEILESVFRSSHCNRLVEI